MATNPVRIAVVSMAVSRVSKRDRCTADLASSCLIIEKLDLSLKRNDPTMSCLDALRRGGPPRERRILLEWSSA